MGTTHTLGRWLRWPAHKHDMGHACAWLAAVLLVAWLLLLLLPKAAGAEYDWVTTLKNAVSMAAHRDGDVTGERYGPYLGQLVVAEAALLRGERKTVYVAMNRFMDMLERREYGIDVATADWLFDLCDAVTPPEFHDVSRHLRKVGLFKQT